VRRHFFKFFLDLLKFLKAGFETEWAKKCNEKPDDARFLDTDYAKLFN